jgi:hypothetical protein
MAIENAMTAEAWIALGVGIVGVVGPMLAVSWHLSGKMSKQDAVLTTQSAEMDEMQQVLKEMSTAVSAIAVDRVRAEQLTARVGRLENWYDELRRGIGVIRNEPPNPYKPQGS